jgi:hypothetical protein
MYSSMVCWKGKSSAKGFRGDDVLVSPFASCPVIVFCTFEASGVEFVTVRQVPNSWVFVFMCLHCWVHQVSNSYHLGKQVYTSNGYTSANLLPWRGPITGGCVYNLIAHGWHVIVVLVLVLILVVLNTRMLNNCNHAQDVLLGESSTWRCSPERDPGSAVPSAKYSTNNAQDVLLCQVSQFVVP